MMPDVDVLARGLHARLDLVGDVRDHLHGAAEVIPAPLLVDDALVDLAGGEVVELLHLRGDEALVVAEVEVGLRAILRHEHLAVLERRHRARIDVDVGIELDQRDLDLARFEDRGERGGGDALAEGGDHPTRHEDILGHCDPPAGNLHFTGNRKRGSGSFPCRTTPTLLEHRDRAAYLPRARARASAAQSKGDLAPAARAASTSLRASATCAWNTGLACRRLTVAAPITLPASTSLA